MLSENKDVDDYLSCTDPVEDRITQFDGNDILDNTEDTS